ncbi:unnamed protein product [Triticum turgidum subsp. durum]|uniref:Reticulon-like protein n=1 Tax=Triticum turgidum subsp. durum TaxID=4567 RepID=A0A9R1PMB8_TRITD|nr:unnamed protein product [Triticum turgidum subsp. durum]
MLGQAGSGKLRVSAAQNKFSAKVDKKFKEKSYGRSGATSGLTSSLAFTPVQGIELSNPQAHGNLLGSGIQSTYFSETGTFSRIRRPGGCGRMAEHSENAAENMMSGIMDAIADKLPKQKSVRFDDEGSISGQAKKLFGGHKSVHHILGGGESADVLLWRNKKISSSVLAVATAAWVFFEWLDYHFLTIVSFVLVLGMVVQFGWSSFAGMLNGSPSNVPRVELPEELFANIGAAVGAQVNKFLGSLQDVSCGRDLKQFLMVIAGFIVTAFIGSWFSLITVIYIGNNHDFT